MPHSASGPRVVFGPPALEEEWECPAFLSVVGMLAAYKTTGKWACLTQVYARVTTISSIPESFSVWKEKMVHSS